MGKGGQIKLNESRPMRVNNKKMARLQRNDCMEETNALFSCIARNRGDDMKCGKEKFALAHCTTMAAKAGKPRITLNYHLQRLFQACRKGRR